MTRLSRPLTALLLGLATAPALAQTASDPAACFAATAPVITLDFPSRYAADSKNRSEFDEAANAAVEAALQPVDDFIVDLVKASNAALKAPADQQPALADCVIGHISTWATADALSKTLSQGAQLSVPSRVAGVAMAYAQVKPLLPTDARLPAIEAWLAARINASMLFFDTEAPPRASQNNLRAWAGLAAAQVGVVLQDDAILTWAADSIRLVACTASPDGSLPNEMWRGKLALHYQIHAVGPLVVGAALLSDTTPDLFTACDGAIPRIARFTVAAAQNPALVEPIAGQAQKFDPNPEKLRAFEFAWLTAFRANIDAPDLDSFTALFDTLSNSKLGGQQDLLWPKPTQ